MVIPQQPRRIATLLESNYQSLVRMVHRRARSQQLAADLVNDAIVICLEQIRAGKLAQLDEWFIGYVFRVSMNLLRNHRRNSVNRHDIRVHPGVLDDCAMPEHRDDVDDERTRRLVHELLEPLSRRNQEVIRRLYLHEEDKDSIRQSLGMSSGQLNLQIWRARQQMKQAFDARGLSPHDLF